MSLGISLQVGSLCHLATLLALLGLTLTQDALSAKPKDYAHSFTSSRVRGLVDFFELVRRSSDSPAISQSTYVVLTLADSASKLYTLSHGQRLELKCDKYVKLLARPNIRTVATISELMKEDQSFSGIDQHDANLMAKLVSERNLDALARIQTILQTLETERALGKSNLEPNVEKDLLDCVNYYVYRHQRATTDIIQHVRRSIGTLPQTLIASGKQEMILRKLSQAVDNIESLENERDSSFRLRDWLAELTNLHELALENDYELPERVRRFLAEPKRLERLHLIDRGESLKERIVQFEKAAELRADEREKYIKLLRDLRAICQDHEETIPDETCILVKDPERLVLIDGSVAREANPEARESDRAAEKKSVLADDDLEDCEHDFRSKKSLNGESEHRTLSSSPVYKRGQPNQTPNGEIKQRSGGTKEDEATSRAEKLAISRVCLNSLKKIRTFLINYGGESKRFEDFQNAANRLRRFRSECIAQKEPGEGLLQSNLKSWCKKNPHLRREEDCRAILEALK